MPTDLAIHPDDSTIDVVCRADTRFPFSRGIMATSILATGIETDRAYQIAREVQEVLQQRAARSVTAEDLVKLAADVIERRAGSATAARYRAWRRVKRLGRPVIIVLGGAPGVGKSHISTRLAVRLGITRVVTTDTIREVLRMVISKSILPELHISTYESIDHSGRAQSPLDSFYRQATAVGAAMSAVASRLITEGRSAILEGAHLLPGLMRTHMASHPAQPVVIEALLTLRDGDRHRAQLVDRAASEPGRDGSRHLRHLETIRALQAMLQHQARTAGILEYDITDPTDLTQQLVDQIVQQTTKVPPAN